jgi:1-deoxy-D-xylulose-5-phosphate synthase
MSLLDRITGPTDLKELPTATLADLAVEIRAFLIDKVSGVGGHLGPNRGVVELTIAAHRVFDSPHDVLLFDTGHQAYVHKILTGRCAEFDSLRQAGGLSGYPSQAESVHDVIENSHASTALSYADGLAKAFALRGDADRRVVAIVGDGALTGGMCWEALNNIGAATDRPVIIVLNDNGRSYLPTVGAFARHLAALRQPDVSRHTLFENLGLAYLGPVDGHDITDVENALRRAACLGRPVVVHSVTCKGRGYPPAEQDAADCLHTVGVIDPSTGWSRSVGKRTWTSVFAEEITAIGADHEDVVCLTAAMLHPTGLSGFAHSYPHRYSTWGSPSSTPSPARPAWPSGGCTRWSLSTPRSPAGRLTNSSWMWPCTGYRSPSCWTGPESLAQTGPATTACGTRRSCRWCPGYVWPRPETAPGYANCSARPSTSPTDPP